MRKSLSNKILLDTISEGVNMSNIGFILTVIRDNCLCDDTFYLLDLVLKGLWENRK